MKYTKQQRLEIGRRIYEGEITRYQAANIYNICDKTAKDYMRMYREKFTDYSVYSKPLKCGSSAPNKNYTKEERLDIGRRIYEGEITRYQAVNIYNIGDDTARRYMRLYRDANNLPPKQRWGKADDTMDAFCDSWAFLSNYQYFSNNLNIGVVKVNPQTDEIDDDESKNTKTFVRLECSVDDPHKAGLGCGGDTFEDAIINLAELVKGKYSDSADFYTP